MTLTKILHYTVGPVGAAAVSFITLPILAHFFEPEDIGRYALLQVFLSLSVMFFSLGLHQSFVREYNDYNDKPSLVLMSTMPCLLVLLVFLFAYILSPLSVSVLLFDEDNKLFSIFIWVSVIFFVLNNQYAHVLRMQEKAFLFSVSMVLPRAIFIVALLFLLLFDHDINFDAILHATIFSLLLTFLFFLIVIDDIRQSLKSRISPKFLIKMLAFGMPLILGGLAFWGMSSIDRFLLKHYSSLSEVALYSVAVSFAAIGSVLTSVFVTIWHPLVYRWSSEGIDKTKLQAILNAVILAVCFAWSAVGLFSWVVNLVLPEYYSDVVYIIPLCLAVPLLYLLSEITQIGISITRKTLYAMLISVIALVVNILLNITLLSSLGALGAAFSSAIAFAVFLVLRTEISNYLMPNYRRFDLYIFVSIYVLLSVFFAAFGQDSFYYYFIWILPLPIVCLRYKSVFFNFRTMISS